MTIYLIIIAAVATLVGVVSCENNSLKKDNAKLHANEGIYTTQVKTLSDTIKSKDGVIELQNNKFKELNKLADEREASAKKAQEAARVASKINLTLSTELLSAKRKTDNVCTDAKNLIDEYIDKREP